MASNKISIIGLGLIGGSIAKSLKNNSSTFIINAFDKKEVLSSAKKSKVIDEELNSIEEAAGSDFIFLCLPTDLSLKALTKLAPLVNEKTIISDVAGVKNVFEKKWKRLKSKGIYIGGHPMTGKEKGGFENSEPLLFENSIYILSDTYKKESEPLVNIIKILGARIRFLNPQLHDKIVAKVSHLPQLLAVSLVNSLPNEDEEINYLDFAAGGFRDMTRIASSNFDIWKPVVDLNSKNIVSSINLIKKRLNEIEEAVKSGDTELLEKSFETARIKRDEIPKNNKGFINPLYDIYVFVNDKPGVLSSLTTLLFKEGINIKDIELLKIREGTGGTFRISFESEKTAQQARQLIEKSGFAVRN
ncbi:MAG: prephenate dehydrogenase/arogenate dehydrogenase family protein [Ignavibacteriaceae bacterium]